MGGDQTVSTKLSFLQTAALEWGRGLTANPGELQEDPSTLPDLKTAVVCSPAL